MSVRWVRHLGAGLLLIAGVAAGWHYLQASAGDHSTRRIGSFPRDYPRVDKPAPEIDLIDQHGERLRLSDQRGNLILLTFAFANCHAICPTLIYQTSQVVRELKAADLKLWIITLDPWRDTPEALPHVAQTWNLGEVMHLLSGEVEQVLQLLDAYHVPRNKDPQTGEIAHPGLVYLIDRSGAIAYAFNDPGAGWLKEAIQRLR